MQRTRPMGFWDSYRASLKPAEVEEPVDRVIHRPLGHILARACLNTPISPDSITIASVFIGWAGAASLLLNYRFHFQAAGLLITLSAVFDCADGQLARMRKTSSPFGRMIDGVADLLVMLAFAPATLYVIWRKYETPMWLGITVVALGIATMVTSSFHTGMYDHYKNVWLRFTSPSFKEGEDSASARARFEKERPTASLFRIAMFRIYLFYIKSQEDVVSGFDPFTTPMLGKLPPHTEKNEAIYRAYATKPFAELRTLFGFGSLIFGLAVANALEVPEYLLLFRLVVMNGLFYLRIRPMQRRASERAFREMASDDTREGSS